MWGNLKVIGICCGGGKMFKTTRLLVTCFTIQISRMNKQQISSAYSFFYFLFNSTFLAVRIFTDKFE